MGLVKQHIDLQKLEKAVALHNDINDDTTPKQIHEAFINVLDKVIDEFLLSKE
ncbi:Phage protein [Bacillus cereus]|nr:Phage protein [Bacillus cereus]